MRTVSKELAVWKAKREAAAQKAESVAAEEIKLAAADVEAAKKRGEQKKIMQRTLYLRWAQYRLAEAKWSRSERH